MLIDDAKDRTGGELVGREWHDMRGQLGSEELEFTGKRRRQDPGQEEGTVRVRRQRWSIENDGNRDLFLSSHERLACHLLSKKKGSKKTNPLTNCKVIIIETRS